MKLEEEVTRVRAELDLLEAEMQELLAKGFTPEIVKEITAIESRSGPNLLCQIQSVEESNKIKREVSKLEKSKDALEKTILNLCTKKAELEKRVRSEENRFDELKLSIVTFKEAIAIVLAFFRDGYTTSAIKGLKCDLKRLGIKGDPLLSIKRLADGLLRYKSLATLEDHLRSRRKELETLKKVIADAQSELNVVRNFVRAFEEVKDAGVEAIASTAAPAKTKIAEVAGVSEKHMNAHAGEFDDYIQHTMDRVMGELAQLQEQKGRLKEIIYPALVLLGILQSPEYLRQLPLTDVLQLFEQLRQYSEMNLKAVSIKPSQDIWRKEANLSPVLYYRLPVLVEFICEGLRDNIIARAE